MEKIYCIKCKSIENLKPLKDLISFKKHWFFILFKVNVAVMMRKYLKKNNQLRY